MLPNDITVNVVMKDVGAVATRQATQSQGTGQVARSASGADTTNDLTQTEHIQQKAVASNAKDITITPPAKAEGPVEHYRVTLDVSNLHAIAGGVVDQGQGGAAGNGSGVMTSPDGDTVEISPELLAAEADQPTAQEEESAPVELREEEGSPTAPSDETAVGKPPAAAPTPDGAAQKSASPSAAASNSVGAENARPIQSADRPVVKEAVPSEAQPSGNIQDPRSSGIVKGKEEAPAPVGQPVAPAPVKDKRLSGLDEPAKGTVDAATKPVNGETTPATDSRSSGLIKAPEGQPKDQANAAESHPPVKPVTDHRTSGIEVTPPPDKGQQGQGAPEPETPDAGTSPADQPPAEAETGGTPASPSDGSGAGPVDGAATP